jgi:hypothetical protein
VYCTVLYCTVLYCTVLYCTVLYCTVLYCTVLYWSHALLCALSFFTTAWRYFLSMSGRFEVLLTAEGGVGVTCATERQQSRTGVMVS